MGVAAVAHGAAAAPRSAGPGYDEVTVPDDQNAVAIVPRPDARRLNDGYAIETLRPAGAASAAPLAAPGAKTRTSLPAGPPLVVQIRFDPHRAGSVDRANAIATGLRQQGIAVLAVQPAASPLVDGVEFAFAEDEAAAASVARRLPEPLGHVTPVRMDDRDANDPAPGTIEITLGGERSTS